MMTPSPLHCHSLVRNKTPKRKGGKEMCYGKGLEIPVPLKTQKGRQKEIGQLNDRSQNMHFGADSNA